MIAAQNARVGEEGVDQWLRGAEGGVVGGGAGGAGKVLEVLAAEPARAAAEGALLEHVLLGGVDGPVVALAGAAHGLGELVEALVEREVVADGVLPALKKRLWNVPS